MTSRENILQAVSEMPLPLFQNEAWCKTFQMEWSFSCTFSLVIQTHFDMKILWTRTRFETEVKSKSGMAYCVISVLARLIRLIKRLCLY